MRRNACWLVVFLTMSCSGSETQDVLKSTTSSTPSSSGTSGTPSSSGTSGSSNGGLTDSGSSGNPAGDCTSEEEPNDSSDKANTLEPARCGTLSQQDQKDFVKFRLKNDTKQFSLKFTGAVRLRVNVAGQPTVEMTSDSSPTLPFLRNVDYYVEITATRNDIATIPWRVELVEQ